MQAGVEAVQDQDTRAIVLRVSEGPRFSIGEIRFEGNRIFSSEELATRMRGLLQQYEESAKGYDAEIFDFCLRQLANFLRSQGYLQARFGEPANLVSEGKLVVTVPVVEGVCYRLGEIKIEGALNLSQEQIRAMLSLHPKDIASGEAIGKWLYEDLKKLYGEMGYVQYMAEPEPEFRVVDRAANEGVVDFKVTIEEGPQFKISSIRFKGSNISEKKLNALLLVRPGDVFNQRLLEKSVEQMNETKRFEMIDIDKDTEFMTDEKEALLGITFRIQCLKAH
jgi:outer membrane protein insertion porin family